MASGSSSRCADRFSACSSFSRLRLVVETIADFRSSLAGAGVTARSRSASPGVLLCAANATLLSRRLLPNRAAVLFRGDDRASNLADLRLPTLWRQTMRLAQIIIFLVGALAAVGLFVEMIMESMAS